MEFIFIFLNFRYFYLIALLKGVFRPADYRNNPLLIGGYWFNENLLLSFSKIYKISKLPIFIKNFKILPKIAKYSSKNTVIFGWNKFNIIFSANFIKILHNLPWLIYQANNLIIFHVE